jgi:hypothetical protein
MRAAGALGQVLEIEIDGAEGKTSFVPEVSALLLALSIVTDNNSNVRISERDGGLLVGSRTQRVKLCWEKRKLLDVSKTG